MAPMHYREAMTHNSMEQRRQLIEEFPELGGTDVILGKELYAHFGLAFMKFGLVEHSLINILTFSSVGKAFQAGKVTSKKEWEQSFDESYKYTQSLTFGNLARAAIAIVEFSSFDVRLQELKQLRDYFAHRFMRDEADLASSDDGCWLLIQKIATVRAKAIQLENDLKSPFMAMCHRLGIQLPSDSEGEAMIGDILEKARQGLEAGTAKVGWE